MKPFSSAGIRQGSPKAPRDASASAKISSRGIILAFDRKVVFRLIMDGLEKHFRETSLASQLVLENFNSTGAPWRQ